jgi:hypothetical protein
MPSHAGIIAESGDHRRAIDVSRSIPSLDFGRGGL